VTVDSSIQGDAKLISLDYKELATSVKPGFNILMADGNISLTVKSIDLEKALVHCVVDNSATLGENKNVHLPGAKINLPALSEKDIRDLKFGVEQKVDMVAASFIRSAEDIKNIREVLGEQGKHILVIAKIESTEGLENFDSILDIADGIMVARGDLGVELPIEQIFIAQKMMVSKCNAAQKPVITATQMLESMILNPRPTRAEATDVANAVLDGSDCVMLSGETAGGEYPIEAATCMASICKEAERVEATSDYPSLFEALKRHHPEGESVPEVVASYGVRAANDLNASMIITITETGNTSRLVCKYRPRVPVICITTSDSTAKGLLLTRAAVPRLVHPGLATEELIKDAIDDAVSKGLLKSGNKVIICTGEVEGKIGGTNLLKVLTVA